MMMMMMQLNYLGWLAPACGSSTIGYIDYAVADRVVTPPDLVPALYGDGEKIVILPYSYQARPTLHRSFIRTLYPR